MQDKKIVWFIREFNDIDHICPIINEFLERGHQVEAVVIGEYDAQSDYHIRFLNQHRLFSVRSLSRYEKIKEKICNNRVGRFIIKYPRTRPLVGRFVRLLRLIDPDTQLIITEWAPITRYGMLAAHLCEVPVVALPHGFNIFLNDDIKPTALASYERNGFWADFSNRNFSTLYGVQTYRHLQWNKERGIDESRISVLGSARFCSNWARQNLELIKEHYKSDRQGAAFRVLFLAPHWDYFVNVRSVVGLLRKVSALPAVEVIIKGHTRARVTKPTSVLSELGNIADISFDNITPTPLLIENSDVVLSFGTSAVFDALHFDIPIINPKYLHNNKTIFDHAECVATCSCDQQVLCSIKRLSQESASGSALLICPKKKSVFLKHLVQGGVPDSEVLISHYSAIIRVLQLSEKSMNNQS